MQGDVAGEQSAPDPARNLQPPESAAKGDLRAPVSEDDVRQMDARFERATRRLQASVERRVRDRQLVLALARDDFQGRQYEHFVEELARYGISVLRGWMHSGYIFRLTAERGFGLRPHELEQFRKDALADVSTCIKSNGWPPGGRHNAGEGAARPAAP